MQLTQFVSENDGFAIRAVHIDEQEWFIAKDVCDVLGIKNSRQAVSKLDEDEVHGVTLNDAIGREQVTSAVNESGLYALILRSKKPQARAFRKWVTSEVLPAIRKTGGYSIGGDPAAIAEAEVERFTVQLERLGLPRPGAVKAAKDIVRARLREMKRYLTYQPVNGERGPKSLDHANRTSFAVVYQPQQILDLLSYTDSMRPRDLKAKAMQTLGISRSSFHRLLAELRHEGKIATQFDGTLYRTQGTEITAGRDQSLESS